MIKLLTKNLWIKLFCLLAATLLWVYVAAGQSAVGKFPGAIKIRAINVPSELVAIYDNQSVEIKIMADSATWRKLSADSFSAYIDLASYSEGTYEVNVNVICSESGVKIIEKNPAKIFVNIEKVITKIVGINQKVEGKAAEGLVVGSIEFDPENVEAKGPKTMIEKLTEAMTTVRLNGEADNFSKIVTVYALNEDGNKVEEIQFYPAEVKAMVTIVKASNIKTVGIRPKIEGLPGTGYYISEISVNPSVIDITGTKNAMSETSYIETQTVNIDGAVVSIDRDVGLNPKAGIIIQPDSSNKVRLRIVIAENTISKKFNATYNPQNLNGTILNYNPSFIVVSLSGDAVLLSKIQNSDIVLNLDFANKNQTGSMVFNLSTSNFSLPGGIKLEDFNPKSVTVLLR